MNLQTVTAFSSRAVNYILWKTGIGPACNKHIWKKVADGDGFTFLYKKSFDVFSLLPCVFTDPAFSQFITKDSKRWSIQDDYVLSLEDTIVEPRYCLAITRENRVVAQSVLVDTQYPRLSAFFAHSRSATVIQSAVLYDGYASNNYFHHIVDAVNRIHVLDQCDLSPRIPFIINRQSFDSPYFKHLCGRCESFRDLNWLVQEPDQWLQVRKLYRLQSAPGRPEPWLKTRLMYGVSSGGGTGRVFLSRDHRRVGRCLTNESDIETILKKHGFSKVYAEHMSLDEQIEMFSKTKFLVALHGAGLVQQMFMPRDDSHIIEIMPSNYMMPMYYWQAYAMGMRYYDAVVGGKLNNRQSYFVDPSRLEAAVSKMLKNNHSGRVYGLTRI